MLFEEFSRIIVDIGRSNYSNKTDILINLFEKSDTDSLSSAVSLIQGRFGTRTYPIRRDTRWPGKKQFKKIIFESEQTRYTSIPVNQVYETLGKTILLGDTYRFKACYESIIRELGFVLSYKNINILIEILLGKLIDDEVITKVLSRFARGGYKGGKPYK